MSISHSTRRVSLGALVLCLLILPAVVRAQGVREAQADPRWPPVATFSIVGFDPETGEMGVAVQSKVFSVGNGVTWGEAGVGVVATQAWVDVSYGPQALELLRQGLSPSQVVETILENDPDPYPERWPEAGRQFSVMNAKGEVTGGHLSFRLLAALEAGQAAGGDRRGMQSAAMLIVKEAGGVWLNNDVVLRLQVDDSPEPIQELRRLVEIAAEQRAMVGGG
jgi:uncharacterized Ntn-hydrolase superfamily protein